jgi:hypothetical protein
VSDPDHGFLGSQPHKAFCELTTADSPNEGLFRAAMGFPNLDCSYVMGCRPILSKLNHLHQHSQLEPSDQPVRGLSDFLKTLATAHTKDLFKNTKADQDALFTAANQLIDSIFDDTDPAKEPKDDPDPCVAKAKQPKPHTFFPHGKLNLEQVNESFTKRDNYLALYQLLHALPIASDKDRTYQQKLEILRTAFDADPNRLARLVSEHITPAQQQ